MVLAIGNPHDPLLREVCRQYPRVIICDEKTLFESGPFALRIEGPHSEGFLKVDGRNIELAEVSGMLLRLPRLWWPSSEFDLSDQMFVYHETVASWFAIFSSLDCPIVNRFGLGWWLQDLGYPLELRASLSRALAMPSSAASDDEISPNGRPRPATRENGDSLASVYIAGEGAIPMSGCPGDLAGRVVSRKEAVFEWQASTGISLCRADFTREDTPRLARVDPFPLLEGETEDTVAQIAAAILEPMAAAREVAA